VMRVWRDDGLLTQKSRERHRIESFRAFAWDSPGHPR